MAVSAEQSSSEAPSRTPAGGLEVGRMRGRRVCEGRGVEMSTYVAGDEL